MAETQIKGNQVKDGTIQRADLDVSTSGSAVIAKVIAGTGITLSSTGPDAGTGDVTINATGSATAAYGGIYVQNNASSQTLTTQNAWYQWTTGWAAGASAGTTPSAGSSNITSNTGAEFHVVCSLSFTGATGGRYEFGIFKNGVLVQSVLNAGGASNDGLSVSCLVSLASTDTIDLRIRNLDNASAAVAVTYADLSIYALQGATGATGPAGAGAAADDANTVLAVRFYT